MTASKVYTAVNDPPRSDASRNALKTISASGKPTLFAKGPSPAGAALRYACKARHTTPAKPSSQEHRNMAQAQHRALSKRVVDRLSVNGKDAVFRDRDLAGFSVRVYPSGKKIFVVQTRAFGRSKRVALGL